MEETIRTRHALSVIAQRPNRRKYRNIILLLCSVLLYISCDHPDLTIAQPNENLRSASDFIKNNYDFRLFSTALAYTGLDKELDKQQECTILATNDLSFHRLGIYSAKDINRLNRDSLKRILALHILPFRLPFADFPTKGIDVRYETLSGQRLYSGAGANSWYFEGGEILRKDVPLSNGILHEINKLMMYQEGKSVTDFLAGQQEYSVFVTGLKKFGLWDELSTDGPFTIFAPTDQALAAIGINKLWLETVVPDQYIGGRLFGTYIMYGRHFFLADRGLLSSTWYNYTLRDDNGDYAISWNTRTEFGAHNEHPMFYDITFQVRVANGAPKVIRQSLNNTGLSVVDIRCENGVVHQLQTALPNPQDARK